MKWLRVITAMACLVWGQDTVWAEARVWGDYVEMAFFWRGLTRQVPLGANFVVVTAPAAALWWDSAAVVTAGRWDATQSPRYRPLYLTHRPEEGGARRVSVNLLANDPSIGDAFGGQREFIGRWRVPIGQFGDTLRSRWGMETGEIVLAPFERAKGSFVFMPIAPVYVCPSLADSRLTAMGTQLGIDLPAPFRSENLTVRWFRDGVEIGQGLTHPAVLPGSYWAEIRHRCGSIAYTDTLSWRTATQSYVQKGAWRVYPQPSSGEVWVEAPSSGVVRFCLKDALGRTLYETTYVATASHPQGLALPALPNGVYSLTLSIGAEVQSMPFVYAR
ncbi:MAG: hypothetical protein N3A68_04445 [Bacteroidia bacterium]|jgi:hypothetical protein|nr:hypothetical protein [Bacteroidia bacterium]GIV22664.1 MAG: hypothetical protein KatS3mg025_0323 [Bacteroidia bacterium]